MLREKCGLKDSTLVTVEEKVAMFLQVVGHGLKMRMLGVTYCRSAETISRHFSTMLSAILVTFSNYNIISFVVFCVG